MPLYVNDNGTWREINESLSVHDGGSYRTIDEGYVNDNGTWRQFYSAATQVHKATMVVTKGYDASASQSVYGWSRQIIPFGMLTGDDSLITTNTGMGLGIGSGVLRPGDSQNLTLLGQFQPYPGTPDSAYGEATNNPKFMIQSNMTPGNSITGTTTWTDSVTNTSQEMHQLFWNITQPSVSPTIQNVQGWAWITRKLNVTVSTGSGGTRQDLYIAGASINKQNGTPIYMKDTAALNFRSGNQNNFLQNNWRFYTNSGGTFLGTAPLAGNVTSNFFRQFMDRVYVHGDGGSAWTSPGDGWYETAEFDASNAAYPGQNARFTLKLYSYPRWTDENNVIRTCNQIQWTNTTNTLNMGMAYDSTGASNVNRNTQFKKVVFKNNSTNNEYTFVAGDSNVSIATSENIFGNFPVQFDFGAPVTNFLGTEGTSVSITFFV